MGINIDLKNSNILKLEELNWKQVDGLDREKTIIFVPISPLEEHGPHLPVGTDYFTARDSVIEAIKILNKKKPELNFVMFPIIPLGACKSNIDFPGSISVGGKTIRDIIFGIGSSLAINGFKYMVICTYHMGLGHLRGIYSAMTKLEAKYNMRSTEPWGPIFYSDEIAKKEPKLGFDTEKELHAGFRETSLMKYQYPYLVDESYKDLQSIYRDMNSPRVIGKSFKQLGLTDGYIGSPSRADADYGRWFFHETVKAYVQGALDLFSGKKQKDFPAKIKIAMKTFIWE